MRTSQLPRLCAALAANVNRGSADVMLFELGRAFWAGERVGRTYRCYTRGGAHRWARWLREAFPPGADRSSVTPRDADYEVVIAWPDEEPLGEWYPPLRPH